MRLDDVAGRYWTEHAQHLAAAHNIEWHLKLLIEFFGKDKLIPEVNGDDVAKLVAWRRGHPKRNHGSGLVSPFTVNATVEQLRKLCTRAKLWGVRFAHEPHWRKYFLPVPPERVRELSDDEADRLEQHIRDDYRRFSTLPEPQGCGCQSVCCGGTRSIGQRKRSASPARAARW
jgi:hypothetical protein